MRRLELRSTLRSAHVALALPPRAFTCWPGEGACKVCGAFGREPLTTDLNVLNFERFK